MHSVSEIHASLLSANTCTVPSIYRAEFLGHWELRCVQNKAPTFHLGKTAAKRQVRTDHSRYSPHLLYKSGPQEGEVP